MRWPFGRPTTVRARIVALALVTGGRPDGAVDLRHGVRHRRTAGSIRVQGVYEDFGTPVDTAVGQIQIERRLSAAYLGAGPAARRGPRPDRAAAPHRPGRDRHARRRSATGTGGRISPTGSGSALDAVLDAVDGLEELRERVLARDDHLGRARWTDVHAPSCEPAFDVQSALTALQAGQLAREAQVVIELVRVREFVSREDALVAGARAAGALTDRQYDALTATIEDRRVFQRTYVPDLPADSRRLFEEFRARRRVPGADRGRGRPAAGGRDRAGQGRGRRLLAHHHRPGRQALHAAVHATSAVNSADRGRAFAYRELAKAAVVGVLGLAAVGLSLWFSVRSGRRISRRLEELRDAADLLATRQLPDVMERLERRRGGGRGDRGAAPRRRGARPTRSARSARRSTPLQRARPSRPPSSRPTLRRGVSAVFVNLARRNQALVHRQLTLLDTHGAAHRRPATSWTTCSASTTSPPACGATPRA